MKISGAKRREFSSVYARDKKEGSQVSLVVGRIMKFQRIYETAREDEIALIKSLLDAEKINYFVENDHVFYRSEALPMVVKVEQGQIEKAKEVLQHFLEK